MIETLATFFIVSCILFIVSIAALIYFLSRPIEIEDDSNESRIGWSMFFLFLTLVATLVFSRAIDQENLATKKEERKEFEAHCKIHCKTEFERDYYIDFEREFCICIDNKTTLWEIK